jgi:PAS domain S-box-containing protein
MAGSRRSADPAADGPSIHDRFVALQNVSPDGFMIFRSVRDANGAITDFEWTFVNEAAGRLVQRQATDLVGRRLLVEMPGNRDEGLFDAYVDVVETGQLWQREFRYAHNNIDGWFRTTAAKAGDGLALSFADITDSKRSEERYRNTIDGVLAFIGVLSTDGTLLEANLPAVDAADIDRSEVIGKPFWDCYWWNFDPGSMRRLQEAVAAAAKGERVRYDAQVRVAGDRRIWIDFQISPVRDARGKVIELIPSGVDITDRKRAEEHRELLLQELSHRVKNTLATIQSIAAQTLRESPAPEDFRANFNARLRAIAASHDLLVKSDQQRAGLMELVHSQVMPYAGDPSRLQFDGSDVTLSGDTAHSLGLILHELATNASKHGSLSSKDGRVRIGWKRVDGMVELSWTESGGPSVVPPNRLGFGTRLIARSLDEDDGEGVDFDYAAEGFSATLRFRAG